MMKGKTVLLGVSGGIAAYKAAYVASGLVKLGCDVHVIMTPHAVNFINPITFETLTGNKCPVDTFDRNFEFQVEHVSLAKKADLCVIAPATANVLAKLAHGIADDMLTTTVLACKCPKIVFPAMNTRMWEAAVTQDNLALLCKYGYTVAQPASGRLACGDVGAGKMPEPEEILDWACQAIEYEKDMEGIRLLVTAGPTQEAIDPVRYITNHSTGSMGYAIAKVAARRGAQVTLVSGPTALAKPRFVETIDVVSAADMFREVTERQPNQDVIVKAAAVADYRPAQVYEDKVKKGDGELSLPLARTQDILLYLGEHRPAGQFLCGFSMETRDMLENSRKKLDKKKVQMIAANNLKVPGAGFGTQTNVVTILTKNGEEALPILTKEETADRLLTAILRERARLFAQEAHA